MDNTGWILIDFPANFGQAMLLEKALLVSPVVQLVVELNLLFCGQMLSLLHELTEQSLRMLLNLGIR